MANNYSAEVSKFFRRKSATGFDEPITYLGAEQRFVGALRNSGVNNLEEQYIIGTDTYRVEYEDEDGNEITETSFCISTVDPSETTDYYKIVTTKYKEVLPNEEYSFEDKKLVMPDDPTQVVFGDGSVEYPDVYTLYGVDPRVFSFSAEGALMITPLSFSTIQEDKLYFIRTGEPDLLVLTKITGIKYISDSGITKKVIKEKIINNLRD